MKILIEIIVIVSLCIVFNSCGEEPAESAITPPVQIDTAMNNFKYPFELNKLWYYTTKNFVTNLRPDSLSKYFSLDTINGYGAAEFTRDTIINQDTLKLLRNSHSSLGHSHATLELYKQSDTGLIRYAFYSDGANFGPFRPLYSEFRFTLGGKTYITLNELINAYVNENFSADTTLYFDDPPRTVLKYPISRNSQWDLINYGTTRVTKKYLDFEYVTVHAGTFYCIKIKRDIYYNSNVPDPDYFSFDYFSKDGMIKRDIFLKDVRVSNNTGQTIGYLDVREEALLNLYIQ